MRPEQARRRSDGELVRDALDGSQEAFAALVRRYQDLLYRHAERMTRAPDVAEDVVQLAFIKAHRSLAACNSPDRFGSWLFRIAANTCKDELKSRRNERVSLQDVSVAAGEDADPERQLDRRDLRSRIDRALGRLPLDQREAFVMKHVEGLSYQEMEQLLGVSVPALKMRVHRARDGLQELLGEDGR